jgi:hypothetical protein
MATDLNLIIVINGDKMERIEYDGDKIVDIKEKVDEYEKIVMKIDRSRYSNNIYEIMYDSIKRYKITNYNLNQKREIIKNILIKKYVEKRDEIEGIVIKIMIKEFFDDLYERCIDNIEFMKDYNKNEEYINTKNYYEKMRREDIKYIKYNEKLNAARYLYFRLVKTNSINIIPDYEDKTLEEILCYIRHYNKKY